jgi:aspartate dehydrogenase
LAALVDAARGAGRQVLIPPGAIGGIDALAAAARLPLAQVRHEIVKPPAAWRGTEAEALCDLAGLAAPVTFWQGPAAEAATRFPQNANVAAITALAGLGMQATQVALVADPGALRNAHRVMATGDFGSLTVVLENRPMASNPKTSELTALSLLRLVANRINPLVI